MSKKKPSHRGPRTPVQATTPAGSLDDTFAQAFNLAQDLHQRGQLSEAEFAYRQILQRRPDHPGALHYLGALALQVGQHAAAAELMERAQAVDADNPQLLCNLGRAYCLMGKLARAELCLRKARKLDGSLVTVDGHLAQVMALEEDLVEAIKYYDMALSKDIPDDVRFTYLFERAQCQINNAQKPGAIKSLESAVKLNEGSLYALRLLGHMYREQSRFPEALDTLLKALAIDSQDLDTLIYLGRTFYDIADFASAEQTLQMALDAHPDSWEVCNWLSVVHRSKERMDEAVKYATRALELWPTGEQALLTMGNTHLMMENLNEAVKYFQTLVELYPNCANGLANLGSAYWLMGDADRGRDFNLRALELDPKSPLGLFNRSVVELAHGNLEAAWPLFDCGIITGQRRPPFFVNVPLWQAGESLSGETLLVRREQGIGDELLHASFFGELVEQSGHCIIECSPKVEALLGRSFPRATVIRSSALAQRTDLLAGSTRQILAGSVMPRLRPNLAAFPSPHSFLQADAGRVCEFRSRLAILPGRIKIAVAWRSRNMNVSRIKFYMTLAEMAPILRLEDICFVSVQYDDDPASIRSEIEAAKQLGVNVHIMDDLNTLDDLDGVAALIDACDLVVCAPTTVARISGGLGKPTFEATPGIVEQHFGQVYCPFTPSVKVIKPPVAFDKPTMLTMLEAEVRAFVARI